MYTQNYTIAHVDFLVPNFVFGFFHGFADDDAWVDLESSLWPWWVWPSLQWTWAMSWRVKMEKERQGGNHWTGIGRLETLKTLNLGAFDSEFKTLQDTMNSGYSKSICRSLQFPTKLKYEPIFLGRRKSVPKIDQSRSFRSHGNHRRR